MNTQYMDFACNETMLEWHEIMVGSTKRVRNDRKLKEGSYSSSDS